MTIRCVRDYAMVSGLCLLLNNAILIITDRAGAPLVASVALSFGVCVSVGYAMHGLVSFRQPLRLAVFSRYIAAMSLNVPVAIASLWLWRNVVGWRIELAAPLATLSTMAVNFALCRCAVFGLRSDENSWGRP